MTEYVIKTLNHIGVDAAYYFIIGILVIVITSHLVFTVMELF